MPDYAALKSTIAQPQYSGMTDAQIASALTAATKVSQPAPIAAILDYLRTNNLWLPIKAAASTNAGAGAALDIFQDGHTTQIDLTLPAAQAMLTALTSASPALLTTAQADALTALCEVQSSLAQQMGFNPATSDMAQEIEAARKYG